MKVSFYITTIIHASSFTSLSNHLNTFSAMFCAIGIAFLFCQVSNNVMQYFIASFFLLFDKYHFVNSKLGLIVFSSISLFLFACFPPPPRPQAVNIQFTFLGIWIPFKYIPSVRYQDYLLEAFLRISF